MINLFITYSPDKWEQSPAFIDSDRALTEYIMSEYKDRFAHFSPNAIEELKKIPCLFAYEKEHKKNIYVGKIINIVPQQTNIRIDYELTGSSISFDYIEDISEILDMGRWEWNRTHWTIKSADLSDLERYFSTVEKRKPVIFVSYSWSPPSNQRYVIELIQKLESDGIIVRYDKEMLRAGQDINYFIEQQLRSKKYDAVAIVCNKDYANKADNREGGVGYEAEIIITQIRNNPMQTKYIPVVIEHNENGTLPLPSFLQSKWCIDLTAEDGYSNLIDTITKCFNENIDS